MIIYKRTDNILVPTRDSFPVHSTKLISVDALCNIHVQAFLRVARALLVWTPAALSEASSVLTLPSVFGPNRISHQKTSVPS